MKKIASYFLTLSILFFLLLPVYVSAASFNGPIVPCGRTNGQPCKLCHLIVGFHNLFDFGKSILVTLTLAGICISGIMYMISAGDEKMMSTAKTFLKACISGFAIVLAAWLIVNVTLTFISAKMPDLGVGASGWNSFNCS